LTLGSFTAFKYAGLSLRAEYFNRVNFDDQSPKSGDVDAQGYYAQAGYMLIPKRLEAAFRGSQVMRNGSDDDELEYVAALSYFFKGHKAKLQMDYTYGVDEGEIMGPVDETRHLVRTMFQLYFRHAKDRRSAVSHQEPGASWPKSSRSSVRRSQSFSVLAIVRGSPLAPLNQLGFVNVS
jgi:hypothetical protein